MAKEVVSGKALLEDRSKLRREAPSPCFFVSSAPEVPEGSTFSFSFFLKTLSHPSESTSLLSIYSMPVIAIAHLLHHPPTSVPQLHPWTPSKPLWVMTDFQFLSQHAWPAPGRTTGNWMPDVGLQHVNPTISVFILHGQPGQDYKTFRLSLREVLLVAKFLE